MSRLCVCVCEHGRAHVTVEGAPTLSLHKLPLIRSSHMQMITSTGAKKINDVIISCTATIYYNYTKEQQLVEGKMYDV